MYRFLFPSSVASQASLGLLVLRLAAGSAFVLHGWTKIHNPSGWMGENSEVPGILQAMAAVAEFGGGICWVLGLLTPLASFLIACTMGVALGKVHIPLEHPFVAAKPGGPSYELALGYLAVAVALLLVGPGRLSLDWLLFGRGRS